MIDKNELPSFDNLHLQQLHSYNMTAHKNFQRIRKIQK